VGPYSHVILAKQLLSLINPTNVEEYLWGAVAPDVRYLAQIRRDVTHLPDEKIAGWLARYPECSSFIQGYRVHCLIDRIDAARAVSGAFPLKLLRRKLSSQQVTVMIELYYHQKFPQGPGVWLSATWPPMLAQLGISSEACETFARGMNAYFAAPDEAHMLNAFDRLGILTDVRVQKYRQAHNQLMKNRVLLWALMTGVKNAHLDAAARLACAAIL
jgi:hypothetical protein